MPFKDIRQNVSVAVFFLVLFAGIPFGVFHAVRFADSAVFLSAESGSVFVDAELEDKVHPVVLPSPTGNQLRFSVENRGDEHMILSLESIYFPHRVFINDKLVSQNVDRESAAFNPAMQRKEFGIPPDSGVNTFCVEGDDLRSVRAYLGPKATMSRQHEIAVQINSFLLFVVVALGLLNFVVSLIHRRLDKLNIAVLLTIIFCLLKVALQQSSPVLAAVLPVPPEQYQIWLTGTTIGFSFSLFLVYAVFFEVQPMRLFYAALAGYALVMLTNYFLMVCGHAHNALLPLILLCRVLLFVWILGFAVLARRPFARSIFLVHAFSDGLVAYYAYLNSNPSATGALAFYVDIAFLGFSVQFVFALSLFVYLTLLHSRDYRRLLMLRGLEHDLKIPLSVIKLNHQMMRRYSMRDDDEKALRFSGAIDRALGDLDGMIENLRYHLENRLPAPRKGTNLTNLFQMLETDFHAVCTSRGAELTVVKPGPGPHAAMNPDALKRVLYNLLDNAFKYGGAGLRVSLHAEVISRKVRITVCDNGPGLTPPQRRKVTELFYKADPARGSSGLGLGLHVVSTLVRQNRGALEIRSKIGSGTTVTITLPVV